MDGWVGAWTGGRAAVHVGDVADFNAQFFAPGMDAAQRLRRLRQAHHYACLAVCYSPEPALLVLPGEVAPEWTDWLARELAWGPVEVHGGVAPDRTMAEALAARPALAPGSPTPAVRWSVGAGTPPRARGPSWPPYAATSPRPPPTGCSPPSPPGTRGSPSRSRSARTAAAGPPAGSPPAPSGA